MEIDKKERSAPFCTILAVLKTTVRLSALLQKLQGNDSIGHIYGSRYN